MLKKMIMPTLGLDMEHAVIERWLKAEGESVDKDEPLLVVETDKATMEINAPATGVLKQITRPAGSTVPVTETIALIETGETGGRGDGATALTQSSVLSPQSSAVRASPAARRVARELGVDLSKVEGTGPAGRIQGEDVKRHAEGTKRATMEAPAAPVAASESEAPAVPAGLPGRLVPLGRKRRVTAERMALSAHTAAQLTLNMEVDASEMVRLRARLQPSYDARGIRLSYDALLVRVVAMALVDHPYLNSRWTDRGIYLVEPINVGVAVAAEDGLVVPVIRDANRKGLAEIAAELGALLAKAREDRLSLDEMSGGSFTITNLGMFGVDSFTPIINPPESAILGVGRIVEKPVGRDGKMVLRPVMNLSLTVDHRVVDGAPAARFLQRVQQLLEEPLLLI